MQRASALRRSRLWNEEADLFSDTGTIEIRYDGVYVGKGRIQEYLKRLHGGQDGLIYGNQ